MRAIVSLFWRICIFRAGPDAVPVSGALTTLIVIANALINISVHMLLAGAEETLVRAIATAVVSLAGTAGLVWFVMMLMDLTNRFPQTITALFAADIILTLFAAMMFTIISGLSNVVAIFATALWISWSLAVYGFIFHRALNIHIGLGIAMALFVFIFTMAITQTAVPS